MIIDTETAHLLSRHLMAFSFLTAAIMAFRARHNGFAAFYITAVAETYVRLRYPIKTAINDNLKPYLGDVSTQRSFQAVVLIVAFLIAVGMFLFLLPRFRRLSMGKKLLIVGTVGVFGVFMLEFVSLHSIDALIYTYDGIIMRSSWMYAVGALVAAIGALLIRRDSDARRAMADIAVRKAAVAERTRARRERG